MKEEEGRRKEGTKEEGKNKGRKEGSGKEELAHEGVDDVQLDELVTQQRGQEAGVGVLVRARARVGAGVGVRGRAGLGLEAGELSSLIDLKAWPARGSGFGLRLGTARGRRG